MPNWVDCDLKVSGDKVEIDKFTALAKKEDNVLSLEKFIPYPKKFKNLSWREWCLKNWGTKWDVNGAVIIKEGETYIKYNFATAWSPPLPVIIKMSELFQDLLFDLKYYEGAMKFKGHFEVKSGNIITNDESTYNGDRGG